MTAKRQYDNLLASIRWIDEKTSGLTLPKHGRYEIVVACYDISIEHMAAIALLYDAGLHGSMLSLVRSLFESVIRGMWFERCAVQGDMDDFRSHKFQKRFNVLVKEIEASLSSESTQLSMIHQNTWKALNGFTHTGYNQVLGRHSDENLGSNYAPSEIGAALNFASIFGLMASGSLANIANKPEVVAQASAQLRALQNAA